ncbi:TPA: RNA polymerase sigma factor [Stenotrophomonas maltophilia]|nr:RNA polymerase sigma factor [Stenotrophomonas maltophilia]HDS1043259.1 RNA polymerase sigma factor [Stenotrophomonas maltophilia]
MSLRTLYLEHYEDFRRRLRRRLGSDDLAMDALQETWLRVERLGGDEAQRNPVSYLFRMAINAAADQRAARSRLLTSSEIDALLDEEVDHIDPSMVAFGQAEIEALSDALGELSERQRSILIAARLEQQPIDEIAALHGVSSRMIGKDLKKALQHCAGRLDRPLIQRFGPGAGKPS